MLTTTPLDPIQDRNLIRRAMRERWGISDAVRQKILNACIKHLDDPTADPNLVQRSVVPNLLRMDALNLKAEEIKVKSQPKLVIHTKMSDEQLIERINELASDLGINPSNSGLLLEAQSAYQQSKTNQD